MPDLTYIKNPLCMYFQDGNARRTGHGEIDPSYPDANPGGSKVYFERKQDHSGHWCCDQTLQPSLHPRKIKVIQTGY